MSPLKSWLDTSTVRVELFVCPIIYAPDGFLWAINSVELERKHRTVLRETNSHDVSFSSHTGEIDDDADNVSRDVGLFSPLDHFRFNLDKMMESELEAHDCALWQLNHVSYESLLHQFVNVNLHLILR